MSWLISGYCTGMFGKTGREEEKLEHSGKGIGED
jgi:hypothetical protein